MTLQLMIKATMVLLAVAAGALALRRASAASRHLTQVAGLVAVLVLPLLVAGGPRWELPLLESGVDGRAVTQPMTLAPEASTREAIGRSSLAQSASLAAQDAPSPTVAPRPARTSPPSFPSRDAERRSTLAAVTALLGATRTPAPWWAFVWAAGLLLVLARLAAGWLSMTRAAFDATPLADGAARDLLGSCCRRLGLERAPRVLVSSRLRVPVLWGFIRPTLFLPEAARTWPRGRLRVVLLHELAHLRRRDGLALLLARLATAAWWFHPLAWIVDRGARRDCERACDDLVLATGEKPSEYAAHLLAVARELPRTATPAGALAVVGTSQLEDRVRSILHPRVRRGVGRMASAAILSIVTLALVPVASARIVTRETDRQVSADRVATQTNSPTEDARPMLAVRTQQTGGVTQPAKEQYLLVHEGRYHEGEELFQRAYDLHREGEYDEAAPLFLEAAEAGYRRSTSLYNAACGFAKLGQADRAVRYVAEAIDAGFDDGQLLMSDTDLDPIRTTTEFRALLDRVRATRDTALGRRAADRYDEIHEAYQDLLDDRSTDGADWYRVGSRLLQLREFDASVDALQRAADLLEQNQSALYNLACAHALMDEASTSLDYLERAVLAGFSSDERFENDTDLDNVRGTKRFEQIRELNETLSLDRFRHKWNFWGGNEYSARRWEPAVKEFTEFTQSHPEIGRGWFDLGWALHFSSRHAEARQAFERQRSLGYRPGNATYNIACTYAMEGEATAALDALERAVEMGAVSPGQMLGDDDLEILHDDPRFLGLVERATERDRDEKVDRRKVERWLREKKERERARVY